MSLLGTLARVHGGRLLAILVVVGLYHATTLPRLADTEAERLASRFRFVVHDLPAVGAVSDRALRAVHPSLRPFAAWISSVGAAVALDDLDGDGLPNDACHVDPRVDRVAVVPVPGSGRRYPPFLLEDPDDGPPPRTVAPMGCLPGDLNEDGLLDLLVYYWGRPPVAYLRVDGARGGPPALAPGGFEAVPVAPPSERWFTNAATRADVDGDGHPDVVVGNYFPDGARILDAEAGGTEEMQHSMSRAYNGGTNRILVWVAGKGGPSPDVRYREAELVPGGRVATGWTLALGAADLDGDLLPELYFANDFGPDRLLHNRSGPGAPRFAVLEGERTATTPASKRVGHDSFKGMGVDFGDVNGDGVLDIYVSNIAAEYALEESHFLFVGTGRADAMRRGVAPFVDRSEPLGLSRSDWGWESRLADFDSDGVPEAIQATGFVRGAVDRWPELQELAMSNDELVAHPGTWLAVRPGDDLSGHVHNPFFVKAGDGRYYDIAAEIGLARPQVTRGIAVADVDGDGDLDFAAANQWQRSRFYRNEAPAPGAFLGLHLLLPLDAGRPTSVVAGHPSRRGPGARPAIGARVDIRTRDGRRLVGRVDGGSGHSGKNSFGVHVGLGTVDPTRPVRVGLRWRDADGRPRTDTLDLRPGWHTVYLGGDGEPEREAGGGEAP